jgi:hypothetical protein
MRSNLKNRVRKLESKSGASDAVLWFADGSTRSVRIADPLSVLIAAMDRISRRIGTPEGMEDDAEDEPETPSKYDGIVNLLGRAPRIESDDVLMQTVHGAARYALEEESANSKSLKNTDMERENSDDRLPDNEDQDQDQDLSI